MKVSSAPSRPGLAVQPTVGLPNARLTEEEALAPSKEKASLARRIFDGAKETRRAVAQVVDKYFGSGGRSGLARSARETPQTERVASHDGREDLVNSTRRRNDMAMQTLGSSLRAGSITQQEYSARVERLAGTGLPDATARRAERRAALSS